MEKPSDVAFMAGFAAPDEPPEDVFVSHPVTNWYQGWSAACKHLEEELGKQEYYTLEEIAVAFGETFHKQGELFFDYLGTEKECEDSTIAYWQEFVENLKTAQDLIKQEKLCPKE